jgi:flavin-dependent dehydrogenase
VPAGYAWIIPMGMTQAKVGIASFAHRSTPRHLRRLLTRFAAENPQTSRGRIVDVHGGATLAAGGVRSHARDGFLTIGDAAGQINPLVGEGIRHALFSGRFAAETLDPALRAGRLDRHALGRYDLLWHSYVGRNWRRALWFQRLARRITTSDRASDYLVEAIGRISPEQFLRASVRYDFSLWRPGLATLARILLATLPRLPSAYNGDATQP